jgi:hypothetical protein
VLVPDFLDAALARVSCTLVKAAIALFSFPSARSARTAATFSASFSYFFTGAIIYYIIIKHKKNGKMI